MDVLTILLIFFIAAAAHMPASPSSAPAEKNTATPPVNPLSDAQAALEKHGIAARMEPRGLVISLPQSILFGSGDDQVSADAFPMVAQIAAVIVDLPNRVSFIGHADSVPIHNRRFRSNWELSAARGLSLLELFRDQHGIPESRLSMSSDGINRPKGSNDTAEGRAENRRVEIVILSQ